jgi:hypothetical protein
MFHTPPTSDKEPAEACERREAELQFIESAYSTDECWIERSDDRGNSNTSSSSYSNNNIILQVKRRLVLILPQAKQCEKQLLPQLSDNSKKGSTISILLTLFIPEGYPVNEDAVVQIEASLSFLGNALPSVQKLAINALPSFLEICRMEANSHAGCEALYPILSCAESWVENHRRDINMSLVSNIPTMSNSREISAQTGSVPSTKHLFENTEKKRYTLVQRLIYSHHIIAKSKRKALKELASKYHVGGYVKIGWPGIIILEGLGSHCDEFTNEIKSMKWQYLNVRGEQHSDFKSMEALEEARAFSCELIELDQHEMTTLATFCEDRGLKSLFKTCMKIYESEDHQPEAAEQITAAAGDVPSGTTSFYGALILVNHMNDLGYYRKWLRKATKSFCCSLLIKCLKFSDSDVKQSSPRNVTVILVGSEEGVKQVIKLWRASRVDVGAYNRPCLERMMSVLIQGPMTKFRIKDSDLSGIDIHETSNEIFVHFDELERIVFNVGDKSWSSAWSEAIKRHL